MYKIRYYDQSMHPDHFKRSGFLGFLIVVLNFLRWKLETFVQKLVLRFLAKKSAMPESNTHKLLAAFRLDVEAERLEKEATSPLVAVADPVVPHSRADKYAAGGPRTSLDSSVESSKGELPNRPKPLDNLIGMYAPGIRAKRYARGRKYLSSNLDGDFEPVETGDT